MNKKIIFIPIGAVVALLVGFFIFIEVGTPIDIREVLLEKPEALKMGKQLLKEHFPESLGDEKVKFGATRLSTAELNIERIDTKGAGEIWEVYRIMPNFGQVCGGGGEFVIFSLETGEAFKFGYSD